MIIDDVRKFREIVLNEAIQPQRPSNKKAILSIAQNLSEIKDEISQQLMQVEQLFRELKRMPECRQIVNTAESYWFAHLSINLDHEHGYAAREETMQDAIDELFELAGEEDGDGAEPFTEAQ